MENLGRFKNQVAIVTGGATGLGKAAAKRLAAEGAQIVLRDIDENLLKEAASDLTADGIVPATHYCDVSIESSVQKAFSFAHDQFERIDVMVNCAGIAGPTNVKIRDVSVEAFDQVQAVNLRGSFLTCREAIKYMEPANYGRILLIASIAGKEGNAGMMCYSTSKAGRGCIFGRPKETCERENTTSVWARVPSSARCTTSQVARQSRSGCIGGRQSNSYMKMC